MPVTDIRQLEERRRALALEVENMRREREQRSGQPPVSASTAAASCSSGVAADAGHSKATDLSAIDCSIVDRSSCLRSPLDWSLLERGTSTANFGTAAGEAVAGKLPERPVVERSRFECPAEEFSSIDRSGILAVSSTKAPDADLSTTLMPTSATGLFSQTGSTLQASCLSPALGNHSSSFADPGLARINGTKGSDGVAGMHAARDVDLSCSMGSGAAISADTERPQVGRLGHADLIERARTVGRETAEAIERAKAPLERVKSNSLQWSPPSGSAACGVNDCEPWRSKDMSLMNSRGSSAAAGYCCEAQPLPRSVSPRPMPPAQQMWSSQPPLSPRPSSLSQQGVRSSQQPLSPRMTSQRTWSTQPAQASQPQSPRPDLHWGATSLHQPSRGREIVWSPRSSITAYPPSPEDYDISQRADRALSVAAGEKTRSELLRDISRESSPMPRRRFSDRLVGSELVTASRPSDTTSRGPPSPASSMRSVRMALPASSSSEHYCVHGEDSGSIKTGKGCSSPRKGGMDSYFSGVEGLAPRVQEGTPGRLGAQEGTPGRLGARVAFAPSVVERTAERSSAAAVAPPPLPQLLSASSLSTSSLWGPRESPWSKGTGNYPA